MRVLIPAAAFLVGASAISVNTIVKRDGNFTNVNGPPSSSSPSTSPSPPPKTSPSPSPPFNSGSGGSSVGPSGGPSPPPGSSPSGSGQSPPPNFGPSGGPSGSASGGTSVGTSGGSSSPPPIFNAELNEIFKRLFAGSSGNSTFKAPLKGSLIPSDRPAISFSSPLKIKGNVTSETALFILRDCGQGGLSSCADDASAGASFFSKVDLRNAFNLTAPPIPPKDFAKFLSERFNRPLANFTDIQAAMAEVSFFSKI